jgi:hypothetical protein
MNVQSGIDVQIYFLSNLCVSLELVVNATPRPLYPRENPVRTYCVASWVGLKIILDWWGNFAPTGI